MECKHKIKDRLGNFCCACDTKIKESEQVKKKECCPTCGRKERGGLYVWSYNGKLFETARLASEHVGISKDLFEYRVKTKKPGYKKYKV